MTEARDELVEQVTHGTVRRMYCGDPECDRDRDKARKREEAKRL